MEIATEVYYTWPSQFSPSGEKLLVEIKETADTPYDLYAVDVVSRQRLQLSSGDNVWGRFSPDGQWVWAGADHEGLEHLYVISADGAQQREVLGPGEAVGRPSFSPDEQWAVVYAQREGSYRLYVVSADGAQQREIVSTDEGADWYANGYFSPDGQRLLVRLGDKDPCCRSSLYVVAADGSQRMELTRHADWELSASFTSDGQHIVFDSNLEGGRAIYVADTDGRNVRKLIEGGYHPLVASGRPVSMWAHSTPTPTPIPTTERMATPTGTPTPTKTPTPRPTSPPAPPLTLQTSSPSSVDAGQSVKLGLRNKWGVSGETHAFECTVVAPDGSQSMAQGTLKSDQWAYMNYPGDFGASSTVSGEYQFTCQVEGQQVKGLGFTVAGPAAPPDPDKEAAIRQLQRAVEVRSADALMPMAYGGSMVFGYYASGNAIQTDSYDEKRKVSQRWLDQWAMQYMVTGTEQRVLDGLSQGIAVHGEATDRAVVLFRTGEQASEETPQAIFLLEKIEGRWWWTSMLLAIFDVAG
jgi:dipeptidyl aminopeptidase/acylaminoacyl peptidase